jgi:hypothetical protein
MANNRLYLVDTETYEWILLAKGWASGWQYWDKTPLEEFLESHNANSDPRDLTAAGAFGKNPLTKLALFTEQNLPEECDLESWTPKPAGEKE